MFTKSTKKSTLVPFFSALCYLGLAIGMASCIFQITTPTPVRTVEPTSPPSTSAPSSTFTPTPRPPTVTPTLTHTPTSPAPSVTPLPTNSSPKIFRVVNVRTDPETLLNNGVDLAQRAKVIDSLRNQIGFCIAKLPSSGVRPSLVIVEGYSPDPGKGSQLARAVVDILQKYWTLFKDPEWKVLHTLVKDNPSQNGIVSIEMRFEVNAPLAMPANSDCEPPTSLWCEGEKSESNKLILTNWASPTDSIGFQITNNLHLVRTAYGVYGTISCVLLTPGRTYRWRAELRGHVVEGQLEVKTGQDYRLDFCINDKVLSSSCPSILPPTAIPGRLP